MTDDELRADLLARIEARRSDVQAFLHERRPRNRRRVNATLVFTSLAAVFTIGPAAGGQTFSEAVQRALGLATDSVVWRVLCLLAFVVSAAAAVLTNITKTHDDSGQLSAAEAAGAELDGLGTLLRYGHLSVDDAVELYQQYTVKIAFVEASGPVPVPPATSPVTGADVVVPTTRHIAVPPPPRRGGGARTGGDRSGRGG